MSAGPKAGDLVDSFTRAARGEMTMVEVIGAADGYAQADPRLGIALYAAWLANQTAPSSGMIRFNMALLLEQAGAAAQAKDAFRETLRQMPHLDHARHGLLRLLLQDSKRQVMRDGRPDEVFLLCRQLLRGGAFSNRRTAADRESLGDTLAYYGFLLNFHGWHGRAEYLYETYLAEGGTNLYFADRLAEISQRRRDLRAMPFPLGERRLRTVQIEVVDGVDFSAPMMTPDMVETCLDNIDVDVISTLRLFTKGEPLLHTRLLSVMGRVEGTRRGPVRVDMVELWTDGWEETDMVQLEEALRCRCIDGIILRCSGDGTAQGFRPSRPGARWSELMRFVERLSRYREIYDLDLALRAWIRTDGRDARERWSEAMGRYGWIADFAEGDEAPVLIDGSPASLEPGDGLIIGVDGTIGSGESLLAARFSDILARRGDPARKSA